MSSSGSARSSGRSTPACYEWEQLTSGAAADGRPEARPTTPETLTGNVRAFTVLVRNALFRRVELAALRRVDALGELDGDAGWDAERWGEALDGYFADYDRMGTGADARSSALLHIDVVEGAWQVRQVFDDPEGDHDWAITASVDLAASDELGEPVVTVLDVGPLSPA
jgi:Domain of unknown function (DUF3516)